MRRRWFAVLLGCVLAATSSANDDLDELRDAVDPPWSPGQVHNEDEKSAPPSKREPPVRGRRDRCDDHCSDDDDGGIGVDLLGAAALATGYVVTTPFWAPAALVDDGRQRIGWFTQYPYQFHNSFMTFSQPAPGDNEPWEPALASLRVESDFGSNFRSQQLVGGHVLWEHQNRWGAELRFNKLWDDFEAETDSLWFGDVNGTYRFAQSEHWLFRGGLGMNWLADHGRGDCGVNTTYQIDWFPSRPLVFSTDVDVGTLGDAWLFHFQQTAGVTWRGIEGRVGYDYLDVGDAQFSMFLCGIRAWF